MSAKKMFTTRIDPDILKRSKILAINLEKPLNSLIEEALEDLLKKYKKLARRVSKK